MNTLNYIKIIIIRIQIIIFFIRILCIRRKIIIFTMHIIMFFFYIYINT